MPEIKWFINQSQVVDGFEAVCFDPNRFQVVFFSFLKLFFEVETVPLVDECQRVLPVLLNGHIRLVLSLFIVLL